MKKLNYVHVFYSAHNVLAKLPQAYGALNFDKPKNFMQGAITQIEAQPLRST
jgi:hypothetical protein